MKNIFLLVLFNLATTIFLRAQKLVLDSTFRNDIYILIEKYSQARETRDTLLLKSILTQDVDQLVSTGEWRDGISASVKGMLNSSANSPGKRTLTIEKIRLFHPTTAIVDCKYEIQNTNGTTRKMWSTFMVVSDQRIWKISAIRNMLPTAQ